MSVSFEAAGGDMEVRWWQQGNRISTSNVVIAQTSTYNISSLCGPPATTHGWITPPTFYSGIISNLLPDMIIEYQVGSSVFGWTPVYIFKSPMGANATGTLKIGAIADVGETYVDGAQYHWMEPFAINTTSGELHAMTDNSPYLPLALNLPHGTLNGKKGPPSGHILRTFGSGAVQADIMVHIGDLAYATGYESEWDYFMSAIEPLSSMMPYMTTQG